MMIADSTSTEIWLFIIGALLSIVGTMGLIILNSIKNEIKEVKRTLMVIPNIDRRVTHVEAHLEVASTFKRRNENMFHTTEVDG